MVGETLIGRSRAISMDRLQEEEKTHDLHAMPCKQTECVDARTRVQPFNPTNGREWNREAHRLAVQRRKGKIRRNDIQLPSLHTNQQIIPLHKTRRT